MTHRQRLMTIVVTLIAALGLTTAAAGTASAAPAQKAARAAAVSTPVTGAFTDAAGGAGSFVGTFTPTSFAARDGKLLAVGKLTGTLTDSAGTAVGTVDQPVNAPAAIALATCRVLDLTLGPLHLDLLGLVVDLNQVHLTINAQSGPGNLLGNLLCAIAGLLDGTPSIGLITALLNAILALLGQLAV